MGGSLGRWIRIHRTASWAVGLLISALIVFAIFLLRYLHSYESTDNAQVDGHISSLGARVSGTVVAVHVDANQVVKAGQLLVELDPKDYEVAVARAEADLAQAEAQLAAANPQLPITSVQAQTQTMTAEEEVANTNAALAAAERDGDAATARLHQAQAENIKAQTDRDRGQRLIEKNAIARQQFDALEAAARSAAAAVEAARAQLLAARKAIEQQKARVAQAQERSHEATANAPRQVDVQRASLSAHEAAVRAAKAALERAKLDLAYTHVTAPIDGIVGRRDVEVGDAVQKGQSVVTLVSTADLWITANFKETQLRRMRPGQRASVKVDAYGRRFSGAVESTGAATGAKFSLLPPENATGNYVKVVQRLPVRIRLDPNPDIARLLRPGLSVVPKVWVRD
jgi:membrane fusion protein (multidrug efflux system)